MTLRPPIPTLFPYTTLFRSIYVGTGEAAPRGDMTYGDGVYKSVDGGKTWSRSEEHTSELQSHHDLVCRLLLEKKNIVGIYSRPTILFDYNSRPSALNADTCS